MVSVPPTSFAMAPPLPVAVLPEKVQPLEARFVAATPPVVFRTAPPSPAAELEVKVSLTRDMLHSKFRIARPPPEVELPVNVQLLIVAVIGGTIRPSRLKYWTAVGSVIAPPPKLPAPLFEKSAPVIIIEVP